MTTALPDVNVLVALFDPAHLNHDDAHRWLSRHGRKTWATCPVTINGCIRVLSNSSYPARPLTTAGVAALLRELCAKPNHEFWDGGVSLLDETRIRASKIAGPGQITDVYLLALAVAHGGKLVTFDRSIPLGAVVGAGAESLEILGA
ncbi:MAG: PIN domain-containing protein [Bryobacterales bacterium]|nr:PIN domain-containing protein [Bryobacterales bacterium]